MLKMEVMATTDGERKWELSEILGLNNSDPLLKLGLDQVRKINVDLGRAVGMEKELKNAKCTNEKQGLIHAPRGS